MDLMTLSRLITQGPVLNKGDVLFRPGQAASSLYMIRTGSVRSSRTDDDGDERIVGFALAGDFAGVAALCDDTYSNTLTAMQTTVVCYISVDALKQASASSPALNRFLLRLLSKELRYNRQARLRLAAPRSRIRVARFIVHHMAQLAGRSPRRAYGCPWLGGSWPITWVWRSSPSRESSRAFGLKGSSRCADGK